MPRTMAWIACSLIAVGCQGASRAPDAVEPTHTSAQGCTPAEPSTWDECDGKILTVHGTAANLVRSHPSVAGPMGNQTELYMDVGDAQLIVVTEQAKRCDGAMTAVGTLQVIDLGGPAGTKGSYRGLAIQDAKVSCSK